MAISVKHTKVSTVPDEADTSLVRPSDWNSEHTISGVAASGANSDITSLSGITGGISTADYVAFDTTYATALTTGQLGWDGNNTLGLGMAGGNVTQHIGEDQFIYVKADSAITKGQLLMFTGTEGASGHILAAPATGVTVPQYIVGLAAESISIGSYGLAQTFGQLDGIDTSGSSVGETWANGNILYYNSAYTGGLTKTFPTSGPIIVVAAVIYAHSGTTGKLILRPSFTQKITASTGISVSQNTAGTTITNTAPDQTITLTAGTGINTSGTYPNFTVANTGVTSLAATSPVAVSSATGSSTISMPAANTTTSGYLTSTDWNTFNNKQPAGSYLTAVTADSPLSGSGTSASHLVIAQATTSTSGYLSSTDWNTFNSKGSGTVTSVTGTSPVASSGGATPAISLSSGYGDTQNPYASKTANYVLAAPNGSSGAPTFRAIVAADIPTLNQNTTGTASNVTGIVAIANGGTNQTAYTSPTASVAGLVWFDGTKFQNDTTTSHVGYNASTNTFYSNNAYIGGTISLAGSTGTAGQVITSNGSGAPTWTTPSSITWQSVQTTNFTASANNAYPINTTSSAITVTLPASASAGQQIILTDYAGYFAINNLTINPNGLKLDGSTANGTVSTSRASISLVYVDATQGWITYSNVIPSQSYSVEILTIAAGGGGGYGLGQGGGSGAGGLVYLSTSVSNSNSYAVVIGAGGAGGTTSNNLPAVTGGTSSFGSLTSATGGGGGGNWVSSGGNGGSGGGGSGGGTTSGGSATSGQGSAGGTGNNTGGPGGGGGFSAAGGNGSGTQGGSGGAGTNSYSTWASATSTGVSGYYCGGGGAGTYIGSVATGGSGGGGSGAIDGGASATNGTANTGSGAGGGANTSSHNGGNGGSGLVIIRYSGSQRGSGGTVVSSGGYTYHTFTTSGNYLA